MRFFVTLLLLCSTISGWAQSAPIASVATLDLLQNRAPKSNEVVFVQGNITPGDWGDAKPYRWDATNTLSVNQTRIATSASATGRYIHDGREPPTGAFGIIADAVFDGASWSGTDNTAAIQTAIDNAIATGQEVILPPGYMIVRPFDVAEDHILTMGYTYFKSSAISTLVKSATYPAGRTDGVVAASRRGGITIRGSRPTLNNARTFNSAYTDLKGTWLIVQGGGTNQWVLTTGGWQENLTIDGIGILGEGYATTLGGIRVELGCSYTTIKDFTIKNVVTGVGIGTQSVNEIAPTADTDYQSDWTRLESPVIQFVRNAVQVKAQNSLITRINHAAIRAMVCVDNIVDPLSLTDNTRRVDPQVVITGGFFQADHGMVENYAFSGVVTNVSGQTLTLDESTLRKVTAQFGVTTAVTNSATMADLVNGVLWTAPGNTALGPAYSELPAAGRVTNIAANVITVKGYLSSNVVGSRAHFIEPAVAFKGDNFRIYGAEVEYPGNNDRGMGVMLYYGESGIGANTFDGIRYQNFEGTTGAPSSYNQIFPRIYAENTFSSRQSSLNFRGIQFRGMHFVGQIDGRDTTFQGCQFDTFPRLIDGSGYGSTWVKLLDCTTVSGTRDTYNTLAIPATTIRIFNNYTVNSNALPSGLITRSESEPVSTATGERWINVGPQQFDAWRQVGPALSSPEGRYDANSITVTATNDVTLDLYRYYVSGLGGIYPGRVIQVAGAGIASSDLVSAITDAGTATNGIRFMRLSRPATKTVSGAAVTAVSGHVRQFGRQADWATSVQDSARSRVGDIAYNGLPRTYDTAAWVAPAGVSAIPMLPFGVVGQVPMRNIASISSLGTNAYNPTNIVEWIDDILTELKAAKVMVANSADYDTYVSVITSTNYNGTIVDDLGSSRWYAREVEAGVNSASQYYSADARYGSSYDSVSLLITNLFSSRGVSFTNTLTLTNASLTVSPTWDSTNNQMYVDATSSDIKLFRSTVSHIGVNANQTYQLRRLTITALGDGSVLSHNATGTNNFQIRINAVMQPYIRFSDANGVNYDFQFHKALTVLRPTDITIVVSRAAGFTSLFMNGQWIESLQLYGDAIAAISIVSTEHGLYAASGQALKFRLAGLTAVSGAIYF